VSDVQLEEGALAMMLPNATTSWLRPLSLPTVIEMPGEPVPVGAAASAVSVVGVPLREIEPEPALLALEAEEVVDENDEEVEVDVL